MDRARRLAIKGRGVSLDANVPKRIAFFGWSLNIAGGKGVVVSVLFLLATYHDGDHRPNSTNRERL